MDASCKEVAVYASSKSFHCVLFSQVLVSILSGVVSIFVLQKCRNLCFHMNCKVLIYLLLVLYFIHSVFITVLQIFHLLRYWLIIDLCHIYISSYVCMLMRFPPTTCMTAFVVLQLGMVMERAIATYQRDKYENSQPVFGIILAVSSVMIALLVTYLTFQNENFSSKYAYCSAGSRYTMRSLMNLCFSLCITDIVTLFGIICVHLYNEKALKRKSFELCSSYQIRETISVIRLLWPLTLFHTVFYVIFSVSNAVLPMFQNHFTEINFRTLFAAAYTIPYYTIVSSLLLLVVIKKSKNLKKMQIARMTIKRNERDEYFSGYLKIWNNTCKDEK